jgi:hypothetical protein
MLREEGKLRKRSPGSARAGPVHARNASPAPGAGARNLTIRRSAAYVDRILRGEKPGDFPVQFPTRYEMVLNLKTAKALGLTVPQSILLRADELIE